MATSITQAKPLLTAAEFELFDHSRAEPIKQFSAKQLAGKEKRCRTLRDKYRDLYRRQTVAQRGKPKGSAASAQDANARTQRKAEIMQEMLERFEARSSQLAAREAREQVAPTPKAPATKSAPGKRAAKAVLKAPAKASPKAAKTAKAPAKTAGKTAGKTTVRAPSATKPNLKPAPTTPSASKAGAPGKARKAPASRSVAAGGAKSPFPTSANPPKARKPKAPEQALSAVASLQQASGGAPHIDHLTGTDPTPRSHKAPSERAPTYGGKAHAPDVNAPLDMVAAAQRGNPVRAMPGNVAIQGHVSANVRRAQGKRDSR